MRRSDRKPWSPERKHPGSDRHDISFTGGSHGCEGVHNPPDGSEQPQKRAAADGHNQNNQSTVDTAVLFHVTAFDNRLEDVEGLASELGLFNPLLPLQPTVEIIASGAVNPEQRRVAELIDPFIQTDQIGQALERGQKLPVFLDHLAKNIGLDDKNHCPPGTEQHQNANDHPTVDGDIAGNSQQIERRDIATLAFLEIAVRNQQPILPLPLDQRGDPGLATWNPSQINFIDITDELVFATGRSPMIGSLSGVGTPKGILFAAADWPLT